MSHIRKLKNLGPDAFINLYDVIVPPVPGVSDAAEGLQFRIKSFEIPDTPQPNKYNIHYKSSQIQRLGSKFDTEHEFTIPIRIDRNLFVIRFIKAWRRLGMNHVTGFIDETQIPKVPIIIKTTDASDNPTGGIWTFEDCFPLGEGGISFDQEGDSPIEVDIPFQYSVMNDILS